MTYPETNKYLESFFNYEKIPSWRYGGGFRLEGFREFLSAIGNPEKQLRCIHVAGSKGKGSTCAFIAYILREAGFKVGLYTSPHLSDFRERIRILNAKRTTQNAQRNFEGMIPRNELARLVTRLKPAIEKHSRKSKYGPLTFFELCTAAAFEYFKEKKTDFAVLETGLGGRLDATNTVDALVAAVTPISYEHTYILGNSLKKIAAEKAGIIKTHKAIVISAPQEKEALGVIRKKCQGTGAKLYEVGRDIKVRSQKSEVISLNRKYSKLKLGLIGAHQLINAAVAIGAVEALRAYNIKLSAQAIKRGLAKTRWPGRCEIARRRPWIILDGAQNAASARALKQALRSNFKYRKLCLVLGICEDKDLKGICRELGSLAGAVILTKAANPRAAACRKLAEFFPGKDIRATTTVREAVKKARAWAGVKDLILITGSLFVVGEARCAI